MPRRRRMLLPLIAVVAVLALPAVGCGGDDKTTTSEAGATGATGDGATGDEGAQTGGDLSEADGNEALDAQEAILEYCTEALDYLDGVTNKKPSNAATSAELDAVDHLEQLALESPDASFGNSSVTVNSVVSDSIETLETGGCDPDSAARLQNAIK